MGGGGGGRGGGRGDFIAIFWDRREQQFIFGNRWFSVEGYIYIYIYI